MPRSETKLANEPPRRRFLFGHAVTHRQKLTKRLLAGLAVVALMAVGAPPLARTLAQSHEAEPAAQRDQAAMPVRVQPATPSSSYKVRKAYTGALVAARRSELGFERPGEVIELLVDEGETVEAGQPLARLDRRRLEASKAAARAELAEARAVLAELEAGPRVEVIATAAAEVRSLAAQRDSAQKNLERRRELVKTAAISQEEFDEFLYATRAAQAQVDAAQKQLDELEAGTRVERVDAQRARVDALEARLEDVEHELQDTILTAPYAGSIVRRWVDEGAIVSAGARVFGLIEAGRLEAWVGVPAESAGRLAVGDPVSVNVNGAQHAARVKSLRPELDPTTRTQNVVLSIESSGSKNLVAGQVARILLDETVDQDGFWVPAAALTPHRRGLWAVYVAEGDDKVERTIATRDVELLHTEGGRSYVRGTLQAGDPVVVAGGHKVVEGQRVVVRQ